METNNFGRAIRKLFLSVFVIFTFAAYAFQQQFANHGQALAAPAPGGGVATSQPLLDAPSATATTPPPATDTPFAPPSQTPDSSTLTPTPADISPATDTPVPLPSPTAATQGAYKDGTYTGPEVDAYYGLVQVQVVIQSGKISNVQFLNYPHDRRTSQEINAQAMPWLQQEAIQAQSANVDIISGATLTSEAFAQSLQAALKSAAN